MEALLGKVTQHAINYAIRSGLAVTGGYAMKQCSRLLQSTPRGSNKDDLRSLQTRLENKIRIISPAIDMIELIAARGNTSLESAVQLTKDIRWEIQTLGVRLSSVANEEELFHRGSQRAKSREQIMLEIGLVTTAMRSLLTKIEDAVPLISLAITTSGVNLSTTLPATVSPSRLLQASTLLTAADARFIETAGKRVQVGPTYEVSMYMLFAGHASRPQDDEEIRATTWKEVIHKAKVKIWRVPIAQLYDLPGQRGAHSEDCPLESTYIPADHATNEYAYQLMFVEDLDDDRVHSDEEQPTSFDCVSNAGLRDLVPIHEVSKIFYADTGKILNIGSDGESNSPVLLLKRDIHAPPPRRMAERHGSVSSGTLGSNHNSLPGEDNVESQARRNSGVNITNGTTSSEATRWKLPLDLDPEWIAFEVYNAGGDSESEASDEDGSVDACELENIGSGWEDSPAQLKRDQSQLSEGRDPTGVATGSWASVKTSLSLLEMLIRLTALQQFRQASHLNIEDELLNFFLADSSTTGAGANAEYRQRVRRDARRRLGFDPYDESPLKRRGEDYIAHPLATPGRYSERDGSFFEDMTPNGRTPRSVRSRSASPHVGRETHMAQTRPLPVTVKSSPGPSNSEGVTRTAMRSLNSRSRSSELRRPSPLRRETKLAMRKNSRPSSVRSANGEDVGA